MEPAEAQQMGLSSSPISDSLSPRRRIETQRTVMPGGTVVTTTTMTTEKPRDQRLDGSFMGEYEMSPLIPPSSVILSYLIILALLIISSLNSNESSLCSLLSSISHSVWFI